MFVSSIEIKNLRCFRETTLEFQYPERAQKTEVAFPNINLLLGNNGSGKSTILRAIALATLAPVISKSSGLVLNREIRQTSANDKSIAQASVSAKVLLHPQDYSSITKPKNIEMTAHIQRWGDLEELEPLNKDQKLLGGMFDDKSPAFLVLGYGTTRRVEEITRFNISEQEKIRRLRYRRVTSLFEANFGLIPLATWLPEMKSQNKGRYTQVIHLIDKLLPDDISFAGKFENNEFWLDFRGTEIPLSALSDGYRNFLGWIADMLYHVCLGCPKSVKLVENRGVVLVDEIDLLLHPEWQRTVIQTLSKVLPNLQFIFTTHSPIVAGSVQRENIYVMESDYDGSAVARQYDERIYGLNAEQILLSSYFGLSTSRSESFVENELRPLSKKAMRGDHQATLQFMDKITNPLSQTAESRGIEENPANQKVNQAQFSKLLEVYGTQKTKETSSPVKQKPTTTPKTLKGK